jgi:hypothetical protein
VDGAPVYNGIVSNAYIVTDIGGMFQVSAMDACPILHIYFVAQFNIMHIAAHHGIEPETALVAGGYIANNGGVGSYKAIGAKNGGFTFYGENDGHK